MRRILLLIAKDLRRKRRAPLALLVLLAFPLLFAGMLALVFGRGGDAAPKVRLTIENRDDGFLSGVVASAFTSPQAAPYFDVQVAAKDKGRAVVEAGEASALLVIPERFTQDVVDGRPVVLQLVRNPAEGILPEVAEQITAVLVVILDGGSRVLRAPLDALRPYLAEGSLAPTDGNVAEISIMFKRALEGASFVLPPAISLEGAFASSGDAKESGGGGVGSIFLLVLPGIAVYSIFLVGDNAMRDILTEGTLGTLRRQLAGPVAARTIIVAKALYAGALALIALVVFSGVAAVFARVVPDPAGFIVLSLALITAVVGSGAAIYGFTGTERGGTTLSGVLYLVMGLVGGSFIPLDSLPASIHTLARFSPFYWGTAGYRTLLEKSGHLSDVLPNVVVLLAIGVALLAVGSSLIHRRVRRGTAAA